MEAPSNGVASDGESVEMGVHGNESAKKVVEFADNIESGNCDHDNGSKGPVTCNDHFLLRSLLTPVSVQYCPFSYFCRSSSNYSSLLVQLSRGFLHSLCRNHCIF
jgi:hypothetical protein